MNKYYYCIDIGGTTIKGGIVDLKNKIVCNDQVDTIVSDEPNYLANSIMSLIEKLEQSSGLSVSSCAGIAVGAPGLIDSINGVIKYSGNLKLKDYPLKNELEKLTKVQVKVANDADVATLAELKFGAGKNYKNFVMLTLGTGIGGGIVVDGHLLGKNSPYSGEIGHIKTTTTNIKCSCGDINCYEAIASTNALVKQTRTAMQENPESKMWSKYNLKTVCGKTVFDFLDTDKTARMVFDEYIKNLGNGIVSLINIFMPEAIIIGGSVSNQKDVLIKPLETYVNKHIYAKNINFKVDIITAEQTGSAGVLGGKCLFEN